MLDLLKIAKTEANGGDLKKCLSDLYTETDVRPKGYENALVWKGGNMMVKLNPYATLLLMLMPF